MKWLKQLFCKHEWELVKRKTTYVSLKGDMIYKRCTKCGKIKEYRYVTTEEQQYFWS